MISWQRAVRLAPGAQDVRANIARIIPTAQLSSHWIPPLSFELSALLALSLWLTAWGLAFLSLAKRWRFAGRGALIVGVLALCMGFISFELRRRVTDRRAAVVTDAVVARSLPALESQPRLRLTPGEVVVMTAMERDWARVELESRAVGWVHRSHLLRIAID
jgi:hypothetical protein